MPNIFQFVALLLFLSTWFPLAAVPFGIPFIRLERFGKQYQLMLSPSTRPSFAATQHTEPFLIMLSSRKMRTISEPKWILWRSAQFNEIGRKPASCGGISVSRTLNCAVPPSILRLENDSDNIPFAYQQSSFARAVVVIKNACKHWPGVNLDDLHFVKPEWIAQCRTRHTVQEWFKFLGANVSR